jgi:uncharacterized protein
MIGERFQVLSLDGGGLRGMFSAAVLARLEDDLQVRITDHFDLIAGTSTGGIIAIGLGLGLRPREIVEFYAEHGPRIFRDRSRTRGLRRLVRAKYPSQPLRDALTQILGQRRFGESTKRLVITSYNLAEDDVYLFRTPHLAHLTRDWRELAVDVAMATAAAPTYLPVFRLDGTRLVDGGMWANNPAMVALTEAASPLGVPLNAIRVLSLGTTTDVRHRHRRLDRGGLLPWATAAVEVLMRAQSNSVTKQIRHFLDHDRVVRINPTVPAGLLTLDRIDADDLVGRAAHASRIASPEIAYRFADHHAAPYAPLHPREDT